MENQIDVSKLNDDQIKNIMGKVKHYEKHNFIAEKIKWPFFESSNTIFIKVIDSRILNEILNELVPTKKTFTVGNDGKRIINSPYKIRISNPSKMDQSSSYEFILNFVYGELDIRLNIPLKYGTDFITRTTRKLEDTAYFLYPGISSKELRQMRILAYAFKAEMYKYYAGDYVLIDTKEIDNIINHFKTLDYHDYN